MFLVPFLSSLAVEEVVVLQPDVSPECHVTLLGHPLGTAPTAGDLDKTHQNKVTIDLKLVSYLITIFYI